MRHLDVLTRNIQDGDEYVARLTEGAKDLAVLIVVHTLSHVLIRQLCYECGYSGAALRERLYVYEDHAGVLIYTADADSEGSLGGLVRQGAKERLPGIVSSALERAMWCSNDPICREMPPHGPGRTNRAACHACTLISETSCTLQNALLDRALLVGDGTHGAKGFCYDFLKSQA